MNDFARALLAWHDVHARDLPWRGETDAYRIWVSEIMLQQTRTETVKGYYERFLRAFPTVYALAAAEEDRVFKLWEGLGYYSRARNLMAAARQIVDEFGGELPADRRQLMRLPGIGEYVSGAVASIAFGLREPALDGNQARVLTRVWDYDRLLRSPAELYDRALEWVPDERPGDYNQALMGLGALVCTPKKPDCGSCPVAALCRACENGTQHLRPVKPEKRAQQIVPVMVAVTYDEAGLVMRKRGKGLLDGLWEYPNFEGARTLPDLEAALQEAGVIAVRTRNLGEHRHGFTHRIWQMGGWAYRLERLEEGGGFRHVSWAEFAQLAVSTAFAPYTEYARQLAAKYEKH
ncbi:MAG: A/G-specific adenine glycosylase [Clostridia bacterium]|nr:A/G-specific adenine glycosylase [Clostridia bacterium]